MKCKVTGLILASTEIQRRRVLERWTERIAVQQLSSDLEECVTLMVKLHNGEKQSDFLS